MTWRIIPLLTGLGAAVAFLAQPLAAAELVVYSARNEHLIKPLFDTYTEKTGVDIRYLTDKEGPLLARLKAEGANTPADILMTVDAGNLWQAAEQGVLASVKSPTLEHNIPDYLRDPQGQWFGLSVRARTIVYSTERVKKGDLSSYEALADPKWNKRLCLRTSKKVYNQSLVATMIQRLGEAQTERVVSGWVHNLAAPPFSNDTKVMEAIAAGQCDVGIVNTYYFGRMAKKDPELKLALFWPNQDSSGVHLNISGAGVTRYAKHPQEAVKLLEWLSSPDAQGLFAALNLEYPADASAELAPLVAAWGSFKADDSNVSAAGRLQARAVMLMDRAGYR
jgi:iron(III) transport system substrate-binding protein